MTARYYMYMICYRDSVLGITYGHKIECPFLYCCTFYTRHCVPSLCTAVLSTYTILYTNIVLGKEWMYCLCDIPVPLKVDYTHSFELTDNK